MCHPEDTQNAHCPHTLDSIYTGALQILCEEHACFLRLFRDFMIKQNVLLILLWHPVFIAITALATLHYDFKFAGLSLPRTVTPAVTLTQCWSTADTFVTGFTDGGREGGAVEEDLCTCAWTNRDRWTTEWAVLWTDTCGQRNECTHADFQSWKAGSSPNPLTIMEQVALPF